MSRRLLPLLMVLVLLVTACSSAPAQSRAFPKPAGCDAADPAAVAGWLADRAIPLKSVTAGAGLKDLQGMKSALKGVRVVALGEATHGTKEFFTMKHRMVEFLVKEMGFTIFGIEASYPLVERMNQYVLTGSVDLKQAVYEMEFWTWQTKEVMDLADWMRTYNQSVPPERRVQFLGFDVQSPGGAYPLMDFFREYDPGAPDEYYRTVQKFRYPPRTDELRNRQVTDDDRADAQALARMVSYLVANRERLQAASSPDKYIKALNMARNIKRYHETIILGAGGVGSTTVRDRGMADTVLELLDQAGPEVKMVLWAHNIHVADLEGWMGSHLRRALGEKYYTMGFAFDHGGFRAIDKLPGGVLRNLEVGPPEQGGIEWYLACAGLGNAIVDFRSGKRTPEVAAQWLSTARPMRVIGAVYDASQAPAYNLPVSPSAWDALIYIPVTTAAVSMFQE